MRASTRQAVPASLLNGKGTSKELRAAIAEHDQLVIRDRDQVRAVAVAEQALAAAEADETRLAAAAIRAGNAMPATKLDDQRAQLETMRREAAAIALAVTDSSAALAAAIENNRAAWQKAHEGVSAARRSELLATLDAFMQAEQQLREALACDLFLAGDQPARARPLRVGWISLLGRNGEPCEPFELVDALRGYAAGQPTAERVHRFTPGADQRHFPPPTEPHRTPSGAPGVAGNTSRDPFAGIEAVARAEATTS